MPPKSPVPMAGVSTLVLRSRHHLVLFARDEHSLTLLEAFLHITEVNRFNFEHLHILTAVIPHEEHLKTRSAFSFSKNSVIHKITFCQILICVSNNLFLSVYLNLILCDWTNTTTLQQTLPQKVKSENN
jgi:hypothetical protein